MNPVRPLVAAFHLASVAAGVLAGSAATVRADTAPVIERVEPTSGPPGTIVHVVGRRFQPKATVQVGSQRVEVVEALANRLSVRIGPSVQSGHIAVTSAGTTVRGPEFRVTPALPAPVIEAIAPAKGPPGTEVVLRGKHFSPRLTGNTVTLAGQPAIVRSATPEELRVIVPAAERPAPFVVRVEQAGEVSSARFELTAATTVSEVKPLRAGPGAQITIRGRGFSKQREQNRVYLNSVQLPVKSASDGELVVQLPTTAASGKLLVDVQGAGRAYSAEPFVVQRPPRVVDFTPRRGPPGTVVTVRGTNLGTSVDAIEAKLGDAKLSVRAVRDTQLELQIPEGARDEKLSIRVNGVGPAWSDQKFSVLSALKISGFNPQSGPAGSDVVIEGEGFGDVPARNRVSIAGQPARVLEVGPTRLKVRVAKGGSGPIHVEVPGSGQVRSAGPFVITVPPQVTSVTPRQGPVGTELRIQGKNFGTSTTVLKVQIGNHPLAVQSVQDNLAVVRVTEGTPTGRLKLTIPLQGSQELDWDFTVLPTPPPAAAPAALPAPADPVKPAAKP